MICHITKISCLSLRCGNFKGCRRDAELDRLEVIIVELDKALEAARSALAKVKD